MSERRPQATTRSGTQVSNPLLREVFQIIRFGVIGGAATLFHLAVALGLHLGLDVPPQIANLVAFSAALAVSFLGHHNWSFRSRRSHATTLPRFLVAAGCGYLASATLLGLLQDTSMSSTASLLVSACLIPVVSYIVNKYWVF